ncbi:D-alanyl-D-alanine carboxypeptidase/D-alanyl-D-alanine-endopeptidase [Mucilaginibacter sp. dw_454]|uniref:D-alanyl-D-alanine carboxypeptidase/D-alanyl-D-alanine endopeptidase n=1 Tax=Mucilaginibacter sp. dw_454 TaxID=2720079 RepID=UPI001BD3198A|nr:D-alanyl-D-alanine carboxypeptidase/D-alanyl-D-alanine-endopeptidase [Mucilaginibacter sp. dw_454]
MKSRLRVLFSLLLLTATQTWAQNTLQQKLTTAFNRLQTDEQCRYGTVSLTVLDAKTGEQVFAGNPNVGLAPGSTLKTVTTITAFNVLSKDFKYQTPFGYNGTISDGVLNGDIIIRGNGDPTLGSWRWENTTQSYVLNAFVAALKKAGIKKINGRIIGDDSQYGTQSIPDGWIWQDLGTYYGAGATALCWHENQFDINLKTGPVGSAIKVAGTTPTVPYLTFKSELVNATAGTGDNAYPYLPTGLTNIMYLRGTYAVDQTKKLVSAAYPDPAYDIAFRLLDTLRRLGIMVTGTSESSLSLANKGLQTPPITTTLTTLLSPSLSQMIYWTNRKSLNLYAEELLKAIAAKSGAAVTTPNGITAIQNFWKARGIDINSIDMIDGCGLSPEDRITTLTVATIMQSAKKEAWFPDFFESLPIYNDIHMKSGSIHNVQCYTGYQTHQGRELVFSIMVNNYNGPGKAIREKIFRVLDELK